MCSGAGNDVSSTQRPFMSMMALNTRFRSGNNHCFHKTWLPLIIKHVDKIRLLLRPNTLVVLREKRNYYIILIDFKNVLPFNDEIPYR